MEGERLVLDEMEVRESADELSENKLGLKFSEVGAGTGVDALTERQVETGISAVWIKLVGQIENARVATGRGEPEEQLRDDLTSDLIAIHDEDPEKLTLDEIASIVFSLSFAGHETSTYLIANAIRRLLENPTCWHELVADPALIPSAVDERCASISQFRRGGEQRPDPPR